jgi:hypothetical protein
MVWSSELRPSVKKKNSKLYLHAAFAGLISLASLTGVDIKLAEKNKY